MIKPTFKQIKELKYDLKPIDKGYNNRSLYVDLTNSNFEIRNISKEMKDKFVGGKGFGLKMLWDATKPTTKWNDPENEIIISPGPVAGITQYPGSGKSLVVSISPTTDLPIDSNVGGYYGPYLKFSGFDAIELQGKSDKEVVVFIDGNKGILRIDEVDLASDDGHIIAEVLTEYYSSDEEDKKNISVVSAGSGAKHTYMGLLNFSFYDLRRQVTRLKQAGRGGIGSVFANKNVKALVVKFQGTKGDLNNPADFDKVARAGIKLHKEINRQDDKLFRMRQVGTANIIEVMDKYDLLPVMNFQYGSHERTELIQSNVFRDQYLTQGLPDGCWFGCSLGCAKAADNFTLKTGPYKGHKVTVDGPEYENAAGLGSNLGVFDPHFILEANFYCDTYAIDTISFATGTAFAMECFQRGLITKEHTNGMDLSFGNGDSALELLHQMSKGEGFGVIVGKGIRRMKEHFEIHFGADKALMWDIGMEVKGLEYSEYMPKESLAQQGGYALANKGPQHDEAWLIFMDMVNNQIPTFKDKAEALHYFPMFRTWFGLVGFCKLPWNDILPENNKYMSEPAKIPEHVANYVNVYNGVTGMNIDSKELILQSERVYNFQRVFNIRRGYGRRKDDIPPYRSLGPVTKEEYLSRESRYDSQLKELLNLSPETMNLEDKIASLREYRIDQYKQLVDAVYHRRGWNEDGIPTELHLKSIGMDLEEVLEVVRNNK
jgi:aldehyde:ferredoxin oxidoreductase